MPEPQILAPGESAPPIPVPQSAQAATANASQLTRALKAAKSFAWRVTSLWVWLHFFSALVFGRDTLFQFEHYAGTAFLNFLVSIRFAPVNANLLRPVLKIAWILTITESSPIQMIGLIFYVIFAPFTVVIALAFRGVGSAARPQTAAPKPAETPSSTKRNLLAMAAGAAWFLLYGASSNRLPILLGAFILGSILILRVRTALTYAQPASKTDNLVGGRWVMFVVNMANSEADKIRENAHNTRVSAQMARGIHERLRWFVGNAVRLVHGRRGRERAALLLLFQYIWNFLMLGVLVTVFWAVVIRYAVLPRVVSLQTAFQASASHVLPGLPSPDLLVPWSLTACISVTAWILFVVYAGPAASVFPSLQAAYADRAVLHLSVLKNVLKLQNRLVRSLRRLEKHLPS